mmetsp:Transcript_29536/g.68924  ORF Transcript_29536/g.68924 Transcript_29536/m.68924 type:complete len:116 (-) Transcript_29536:382-729(-)
MLNLCFAVYLLVVALGDHNHAPHHDSIPRGNTEGYAKCAGATCETLFTFRSSFQLYDGLAKLRRSERKFESLHSASLISKALKAIGSSLVNAKTSRAAEIHNGQSDFSSTTVACE